MGWGSETDGVDLEAHAAEKEKRRKLNPSKRTFSIFGSFGGGRYFCNVRANAENFGKNTGAKAVFVTKFDMGDAER